MWSGTDETIRSRIDIFSLCFNSGVEKKEDIQHLDHEIKELNESNMKIEADMMQLQTQVNIHSDMFTWRLQGPRSAHFDEFALFSPLVPESRYRLWNVT